MGTRGNNELGLTEVLRAGAENFTAPQIAHLALIIQSCGSAAPRRFVAAAEAGH